MRWSGGSRHLDGEDGLLIQQVESDAVLLNTALSWFRKRRQRQRRKRLTMWLRSPCPRCLKRRRPSPPCPQGRHFRKLEMSRKPSVWLFSGWTWVPAMLSIPTIAVTGPP